MRFILLVTLMFTMLSAWGGQQPIASISDPSGDDHGSGALIYPQRADFKVGDLDLIQLQVSRDTEGFWFEAKFRNAIRDPAEASTVSGESLTDFARKGFYQFNIDIYVDIDRLQRSGNTFTLPGRQLGIDPSYAWERAVILTPRPEVMRQQLLDTLAEQYPGKPIAEIDPVVDQAMFFPTRIRVRGKSIVFFVPAKFFPGSDRNDWGITVFVTGAISTIPADFSLLPSMKKPLDRLQLGVMQPASGYPKDTFGYKLRGAPSPVVDLLSAASGEQERQLAAGGGLLGVDLLLQTEATSNAGGKPVVELKTIGSTVANPVMYIGNLLQQETPVSLQPESRTAESAPPADMSIAKRLQTLQQLLDQKLIDENEYKEQRQRILKEM